jgi:hypothetical protein
MRTFVTDSLEAGKKVALLVVCGGVEPHVSPARMVWHTTTHDVQHQATAFKTELEKLIDPFIIHSLIYAKQIRG